MQLRPYQEEAKQAIFDEWNKGINRTLLVLPTGCGKTIVFAKVTEEQVKQGDRVLILAHRFELLQQACDKIEQATGLKSAMEKAEYTYLYGKLVSCGSRFCPDVDAREAVKRICK